MYNPAQAMSDATINLTRAFFFQTPVENPIHFRPMEARMDNNTYNELVEQTNRGQEVNRAAIAGLARKVIAPSFNSRGMVDINGGWDQKRFACILEFTINPPGGMPGYREVLMGYTNYDGITPSGLVDPKMVISLNANMRINDSKFHTPQGIRTASRVADASQILNPISVVSGNQRFNANHAMRPADALRMAQANMVFGNEHQVLHSPQNVVADGRNIIQPRGLCSDYYNNSAATYLGNIIQSHRDIVQSQDDGTFSQQEAIGEAANSLVEYTMTRSSTLARLLQGSSLEDTGTITFGELEGTFGHFMDRTNVAMMQPGQVLASMADQTEQWGGSTYETNTAHALTHMLPAIMTRNLAANYSYTLTNRTMDGRVALATTGFVPLLDNPDQTQCIKNIESEIMSRVVPELFNDGSDFEVTMQASLSSNSQMTVALFGNPAVPYSAPNYCSSVATSVVSNDPLQAARIGSTITSVLDINEMNMAGGGNPFMPNL